MSDEGVLPFTKILKTLHYDHAKDSNSKRTKSIKKDLNKRVSKIRKPRLALPTDENEETPDDLQGDGMKIIIPSKNSDVYTRLEVLLELKLSGHTDTLIETSNSIDE